MSPALRAAIQATPIPMQNGQAVEASVTTDEAGAWRLQWNHDGGRRPELFGQPMELRDALDACQALNARGAL